MQFIGDHIITMRSLWIQLIQKNCSTAALAKVDIFVKFEIWNLINLNIVTYKDLKPYDFFLTRNRDYRGCRLKVPQNLKREIKIRNKKSKIKFVPRSGTGTMARFVGAPREPYQQDKKTDRPLLDNNSTGRNQQLKIEQKFKLKNIQQKLVPLPVGLDCPSRGESFFSWWLGTFWAATKRSWSWYRNEEQTFILFNFFNF